jgi:glutathione S-transferase
VKVRGYLKNPNICTHPKMKKVYEDALKRLARPGPSVEELSVRANKAMSLLDDKLKDGPWLLGKEHTAVDCVASIWVQWIVWSNEIKVTPRVMDFLERSKERPVGRSASLVG